ncbi:MAG: MFS transporter [Elusimicrobiaceae bacterium]|nr:MFS transporter [Elusimicrobiaceae bacterium]
MTGPDKTSTLAGWTVVCASFTLIFGFSAVDHAISPLVESFSVFYGEPLNRVLWLISTCTAGIVCGILAGPALLKAGGPDRLARAGAALLVVPLAFFLLGGRFHGALAARFLFGLGAGMTSTVMWWLTYEGVPRRYYTAMVTVLMAARPMAVAAGVPLAGYIAYRANWRWAFAVFLVLIIAGGLVLLAALADKKTEPAPLRLAGFFSAYRAVLAEPNAILYYGGLMLTRICYFGFYSMLGIWMIKYYGLDVSGITLQLTYIGMAETLVNFIIPPVLGMGRRKVFDASVLLSAVLFIAMVYGALPLWGSVLLIAGFVMFDRVYTMAGVMAIPEIFPALTDKTATGNMVTLTSWIGLAVISAAEGAFLSLERVPAMATALVACLLVGLACLYRVQPKT